MGSEPDPLGVNNGLAAPPPEPPEYPDYVPDFILPSRIVDPSNMTNGCQWGGLPISCDSLDELNKDETWVTGDPSAITVNNRTGFGSGSDASSQGNGGFGTPSENAPQIIRVPTGEGSYRERLHFIGMWQTGQQKSAKAEFNKKNKDKFEAQRQKLINILLNDKQCRDFLLGITGLSIDDLIETVGLQRPFDGRNSSISSLDAGVVSPKRDLSIPRQMDIAKSPISSDFKGLNPFGAETAV